MDENEFATDEATGWLREHDADTSIAGNRAKIAEYNGWDEEWYADKEKLKQFYQAFQGNSGVVGELDELGGLDDSSRADWLMDAMDAQHQEPAYDASYNLWYRCNNITGEYWWHRGAESETPEPRSTEWFNQSLADQIAVNAQAEGEQQAEASEGVVEEAPETTWDENWNMFYRLAGGGAYQYAFSTTGDGNGEPRETWYDYQDVPDKDPETVAAVAEPEAEVEAEVPQLPPSVEAALEDAAGQVFADMDAEVLASLDLSGEAIDSIADAVAAQVASGIGA
jgi:hypothetical protein